MEVYKPMAKKIKLSDAAKDLGMFPHRNSLTISLKRAIIRKKLHLVLTEEEMDSILEHYTKPHEVKSLDEYFASKNDPVRKPEEAPKEEKKPAAKKPAEKKDCSRKKEKPAATLLKEGESLLHAQRRRKSLLHLLLKKEEKLLNLLLQRREEKACCPAPERRQEKA